MKKILHVLDIKTAPREIFRALTLPDGLSAWWTTNVEAKRSTLHFHFNDGFNPKMRIRRQEPDEEVHWQCVNGHDPWHESTLTFALEDKDSFTRLIFIQNYVNEVSEEQYGIYNFNWGYYLDSLRLYCETGEGKPFKA